jgi:hypothetical protein
MAIGVAQAVSVCLAMLNPCTAKKKSWKEFTSEAFRIFFVGEFLTTNSVSLINRYSATQATSFLLSMI